MKKITGKPAIIVGSVGLHKDMSAAGFAPDPVAESACLEPLIDMFTRDEFDIVAVGRGLIGNADWCDLVRRGEWKTARAYSSTFPAELA